MKIVIISKAHEKLSEFFIKQGSFEIIFSLENLSSNLDKLKNSIIRVDKFIFVVSNDFEFATEIRSLLSLLDTPSGLLKIGELVFFYKNDLNAVRIRELIKIIADNINVKASEDDKWIPPNVASHEMQGLRFNDIYKELMGRSTSRHLDPKTIIKYRVERGEESHKAFEPSKEKVSVSPFEDTNMDSYRALKSVLKKTESPVSLSDLERLIPEYEDYKLEAYYELSYAVNKWVLSTGDRMSGSTTHATAVAVAAVKAGRSVLVIDLTSMGGIKDSLKVAVTDFYELTAKEILSNSVAFVKKPLCIYENNSKNVLCSLLPYIQSRPNIFSRDLIIVSFDLSDIELVLGSISINACSILFSSLMFPESIKKLLSINLHEAKTLVWLNDNVLSPLRKNKFTIEYISKLAKQNGKDYRFMEPIYFEDFNLEGEFYTLIEEVL